MDIDTPLPFPFPLPSSPSVLLVEADPALTARYTAWLEDEYDVQTVENRAEAIDAIDAEIDVIVVDQRGSRPNRAPESNPVSGSTSDSSSNGEPIRRTIRDRKLDCRLAILAAAESSSDVVQRGADDYLVAPISATDLRRVVDQLAMRAIYDDQLRTLYELASKRALLDRDRHDAELAASRRYAVLEDRLAVARTRADETMAALLASPDERRRRDAIRDVLREDEN